MPPSQEQFASESLSHQFQGNQVSDQELRLAETNGSVQETMTQRLDALESDLSRRETLLPQSPIFEAKYTPGSFFKANLKRASTIQQIKWKQIACT
jgi:hypothetical protein